MNDRENSAMKMLNNLPDFLLWDLFKKTGRIEYYIKYCDVTKTN